MDQHKNQHMKMMAGLDRGGYILRLLLSAVTGFNSILLIKHAGQRNGLWFILILLVGFLLPGAIPFSAMMDSLRAGELHRRWREIVAGGIGAVDCWAIIHRWPEGLEDLSWVSLYIIVSGLAFLGLTRSG
jgi:hypothetical protein